MANKILTPEVRIIATDEVAAATFFNAGEGPESELQDEEAAAFDLERYLRGRSRYVGNPRTEDPDSAYYIGCELMREQGADNLGRLAIEA